MVNRKILAGIREEMTLSRAQHAETQNQIRLSREQHAETQKEIRLSREQHAETQKEIRLSREQHAELREFTREITREFHVRMERLSRDLSSELRAMREQSEAGFARFEARFDANTEAIRANTRELLDGRDENRAQTRALLRVLDRLDPGTGAAD